MNLSPCTYIDPPGRLIHDENTRCGCKPFSEHDLLLISAGKIAHHLPRMRRLDSELIDILSSQGILRFEVDKWSLCYVVAPGYPDVLAHRHRTDQTLALAILRHISDAQLHCVCWTVDLHFATIHLYRSRLRRHHAENRLGQLGSPGSDQSSQSNNFTSIQFQTGIA